jgi:hypothetical protein
MSVGKLTATAAVKIDHFITEKKEKKVGGSKRREREERERNEQGRNDEVKYVL